MSARSLGKKLLAPTIALALLSTAMVATTPATAQRSLPQDGPKDHPAQKLVSIDFPGGGIAQYYKALQAALGQNVVVIMPGAETVIMPPVKLTNVPFGEAVRVARYVRGGTRLEVESEGQTWVVAAFGDQADPTILTKTWSVADVIGEGKLSADALLSAVHAANQLQHSEPEMRYHDEAKLLIVRGTHAELKAIDETLHSTGYSLQRMNKGSSGKNVESRLRKLEDKVAALQKTVDALAR